MAETALFIFPDAGVHELQRLVREYAEQIFVLTALEHGLSIAQAASASGIPFSRISHWAKVMNVLPPTPPRRSPPPPPPPPAPKPPIDWWAVMGWKERAQ